MVVFYALKDSCFGQFGFQRGMALVRCLRIAASTTPSCALWQKFCIARCDVLPHGMINGYPTLADWLNKLIVRDQLKIDIRVCLIKNGYPPQYSPEVFRKVMEQVDNFEENH